MMLLVAPSDVRNTGRRGKIASLETSVNRLTIPRPTTVDGSLLPLFGGISIGLEVDVVGVFTDLSPSMALYTKPPSMSSCTRPKYGALVARRIEGLHVNRILPDTHDVLVW
jgi:hypothetical protein